MLSEIRVVMFVQTMGEGCLPQVKMVGSSCDSPMTLVIHLLGLIPGTPTTTPNKYQPTDVQVPSVKWGSSYIKCKHILPYIIDYL